jgi:hypothetical protein
MASNNPGVGITCLATAGAAAEAGLLAAGLAGKSKIRSFVPEAAYVLGATHLK